MKFNLDVPRDCDRFADTVSSLQGANVKFYVVRKTDSDGHLSKYAEICFGEDL